MNGFHYTPPQSKLFDAILPSLSVLRLCLNLLRVGCKVPKEWRKQAPILDHELADWVVLQ